MLAEETAIRRDIRAFVFNATPIQHIREDLVEEVAVHLWKIENEKPGQTKSWYVESCRLKVQDTVKRGRSLDSPKPQALRTGPDTASADWDAADGNGRPNSRDDTFGEVSARDIFFQLVLQLPAVDQAILYMLIEGRGVREIGRLLSLSHAAVIAHRRQIAHVAERLGI